MPSATELSAVAQALYAAYASKKPVSPPRDTLANLTVEDAYAIQQEQERAFVAAGHTVIGRKIGLTSVAMQQQLGVDSPDFGFFTDRLSFAPGEQIPVDRFIAPKVEPELAFKLSKDLGQGASFDDVLGAIESVHLAVELIDSRVRDWDITLADTIADNASCGAVIVDPRPASIALEDLEDVPAVMYLDGAEVGRGSGSAVMGHPLKPLEWLANVLGTMGVPLKAGQVVLTGSFCGAAPVAVGSKLVVDYGIYGSLETSFI
ncbi:fumarylacetoacetate hydrolase family protein [Corynebacterium lizhenjunii]|uniref:Fumarylacetoacetate hydrolase family protein n=1 Tax=Corynebacterium lizhenjunii TaxID=2709394 RepID=A0A7T0PB74_9CORY|nr:fumarylacetoacetate hydrolase family protein [Corynebacterium lizhenjunii]QPK79125.1 fumarylacetoacetate hydrolase family protein [Corynebacterium lizhenjunii]